MSDRDPALGVPDGRVHETPETRRDRLRACLGGPWPEPSALRAERTERRRGDGYHLERLRYEAEPGDWVSAWLLIPESATPSAPAAAVAVWHQHAGVYEIGKSEPAGLAGDPRQHVGAALAREGYVAFCPDALGFEERQDPEGRLAADAYERYLFLKYVVAGKSLAWKNILDMRRAVDVLAERPEVDQERLGCFGHSMGATHAWLVGPHEPRLKALAANACLPTYAAIDREKILHCFSNFVPGWGRLGDTPDIAALIAPRPFLLGLGEDDAGSPIEFARAGVARIRAAYAARGASDRFSSFIQPNVGHELTEAMWTRTREFFARHL